MIFQLLFFSYLLGAGITYVILVSAQAVVKAQAKPSTLFFLSLCWLPFLLRLLFDRDEE